MAPEKPRKVSISSLQGKAGLYQVQDEILSPAVGQVTAQERNEGAGIDGPRFDNYKHDRCQAVADNL